MNTDEAVGKSRIRLFPLITLIIAVTVSAAYLGAPGSVPLAVLAVVFAALSVMFTKSWLCFALVALPAAFVGFNTVNFNAAAAVCAVTVGIGAGAFLIKTVRSKWLVAVIPAAYLVAFAVSFSPITSLLSLAVFPASVVLALSAGKGRARLAVICRVAVTLAATVTAAVAVWSLTGGMNGGVSELPENILERLVSYFTEQYAGIAEQYSELGIDASEFALTAADAKIYAVTVFGVIPALAVTALNAVSFVSCQITLGLFESCGQTEYLTPGILSFAMSWVSAVVFIASYLVMFFTSFTDSETVSLIAENVYLILLPGLAFTGILVLLGKGRSGRRRIFTLIFLILLALPFFSLASAIAAFIGCTAIISAALHGAISHGGQDD